MSLLLFCCGVWSQVEQHLCSVVTALANLGRGFHSPAHPGDRSCPSGVLGTLERMEVFFFSRALWCWACRGLGTELRLSFPQVPLKMFPQLLLPLQLWVMWQVPGQVLILIINILLLVQVHVPQPVPLPLAPQEE